MLTEMQVRKMAAPDKNTKIRDGLGLYIVFTPARGKLWRFDYRFGGKRKTLSLGQYPAVKLAAARQLRDNARRQLDDGVDPARVRAAKNRHDYTVDTLARQWFADKSPEWSDKHKKRMWSIIEKDLPIIGEVAVTELDAMQVEQVIRACQLRSNEMARRLQQILRGVYDLAIRRNIVRYSPMPAMRDVVPPVTYNHYAAPTEPDKIGDLMRAIDSFGGSFIVHCALRLAPRLFCRPGELRNMEWAEINFVAQQWVIPGSKMKQGDELIVPLAQQCVDILQQIHPLTGHGKYVFPSVRSSHRTISDATINAALRRMGFTRTEITGHGFRAMARTVLDEVLRYNPDAIEAQLAHRVPDRLGRAYNRTRHLDERVRMMQEWADWLERVKNGALT